MSLPSGLPPHVSDAEVIARHVYTNRHLTSEGNDNTKKWAKPQAFLPVPSDDGWVFSVSRTLKLEDARSIQRNGIEIGKVSSRSYKGSALLTTAQVRATVMKDGEGDGIKALDVVAHEADDGSTPYHAHVAGFLPLPEGANLKEYFKEAAEDLARKAREQQFILGSLAEEPDRKEA